MKTAGVQRMEGKPIVVQVIGDEGLEMPLTDSTGAPAWVGKLGWLSDLVNSRQRRNWSKIERLEAALLGVKDEEVERACEELDFSLGRVMNQL